MDLIFIHAPVLSVIDVFNYSFVPEPGILHTSLYASIVTVIPFIVDKE
jgi:hypothetical protein